MHMSLLVHCDPAPPHPAPGEISNAICFYPEPMLAIVGLTLAIGVVLAVMHCRTEVEE